MARHIHRSSESVILQRWLRWTIYAVTTVLFATGLAWLCARYGLRQAGTDELPHPAEPWILRAHGLAMMIGLLVYGSLLRSHMIAAWNRGRNKSTGLIIASVLGFLVLTGYLLYYVGGEATRPVISELHWIVGLATGAALPLHVWQGRRERRQASFPHPV